jgi:hypothetical protein
MARMTSRPPEARRLWPSRGAVLLVAVAAVMVLLAGPTADAAAASAVHRSESTLATLSPHNPARAAGTAHLLLSRAEPASPAPDPSHTRTASPAPMPTPAPQPQPSPAGGGGCGFFDFGCQIRHAIDSWFTGLVTSAINPLFTLLGKTLLSTPQVGGFSTVRSLWAGSVAIADACYVLLVLFDGILVMSHQTLQSSYAVKDIAPRLVVGFIAANLSLLLAGKAIQFADGMSTALAGQGLDPAAAGTMLRSLVERVLSTGGMFFILLALFAVALVLVLTIIYVARLMLTVVLIAMAPLALACHALPQTEGFAQWWWRAFAGILAIQAAQSLVLVAAMRVFFTEQWASLILTGPGGQGGAAAAFDAVQLICLLYILIRIPFWIFRRVWTRAGRSPVRSAARFVFAAAVLRRVAPALSGRAGRRGPGGRPGVTGRPRPGGPGGPGSSPGRGRSPRPPSSPSGAPGGRSSAGSGAHTGRGRPGAAAPPGSGPGTGPSGSTGPGGGRPGGTSPRGATPPGPRGPHRPGSGSANRRGPGPAGTSSRNPVPNPGPPPTTPNRAARPSPQRQPSRARTYYSISPPARPGRGGTASRSRARP